MHACTSPVRILKAEGKGRFVGIAWSLLDTPDRAGDFVLPSALEGAVELHRKAGTNPVVLVEHQADLRAGTISAMRITDRGLEVEGAIALQTDVGRAAYGKLESGELGALSMGFNGAAEASGKHRIFTECDIREISLCREPMNAGARISAVKSWADVTTERDLERLLHDVAGMPNRLARKTALAAWPVIEPNTHDAGELHAALSRIIGVKA